MILNNNNKFDIDLKYGQIREEKLADILQNEKVEVKTERDKWKQTGNICIEFRCRGKPSGIAVTEAKWWVHILENGDDTFCMLMFPTEKLKEIARKYYANGKIVNGGDDNLSKMVLLPLKEIFK
jgi:hypothetical protein|tara:strand:+ start:208 stop:579 length:372 start_codon:yes stop_codon:yes gene_type:complete